MTGAPDTVAEVLAASIAWLERRGVDAPRRSVELLLGRVLGLDRLQLYLQHDRPLTAEEKDTLRPLIARRGEHEPVAHLLGDWEFFGYELEVGPAVLIPRPETEGLIELALELCPEGATRAVDLGTGSGAIAIALAMERPELEVDAVDLSAAALEVARRNVAKHGLGQRVHLHQGEWWQPLKGQPRYQLALSNPPYVDPALPELLAEDVAGYEPELALLTPPGEPEIHYRRIAAEAAEHLAPGGWLLMETGVGAAEPSLAALREAPGLSDCELRDDLAGLPRYLLARRS